MGRRLAARLMVLTTVLALVAGTGGRVTEAQNELVRRLDLAAMTLDGNDLPDGALLYVEQYLTPGQFVQATGGLVERQELADAGLRWYYESRYVVPTEDQGAVRLVYRSYVQEFRTAESVEAGFAILEDEERFGVTGLIDAGAPEVGQEPREVTTGSVPPSLPSGGGNRSLYDLTFRVENVLAGISVEAADPNDVDPAEVEELGRRLAERIEAVLAGDEIEGIDPTLRQALLPFDARLSVQEGYQTAQEAPYTTTDPASDVFEGYLSGYAASYALNLENNDVSSPAPYVTLAISSFEDEDGPTAVLAAARDLQGNLIKLEQVDDVEIEGADEAVGFRFSSPATAGLIRDSFRVLFAVGDRLVAIDVQGMDSAEAAQAAALALAAQQLACLDAGGQCASVDVPGELAIPAEPSSDDGTGGDDEDA